MLPKYDESYLISADFEPLTNLNRVLESHVLEGIVLGGLNFNTYILFQERYLYDLLVHKSFRTQRSP